jgi:murein DD-endopeptidase MepM/ murein hydrolase activator NlpD
MINKRLLNVLQVLFLVIFMSYESLLYVDAATTLKGNETMGSLRQTLKDLQAKQAAQNNKKNQTKNQIAQNKRNKANAEDELYNAKIKVSETENKIERTKEEIEELKKQIEELLVFYQKGNSENVYLNYLTGSTSVTELIMRMDAVNIITESNKQKLDEMETLVKNNEKMNKQLVSYQAKLDKKIVDLENANEALGEQLAELEEGAVTIQDEIKNMQSLIKYYEGFGCKDNQLLSECLNVNDNAGWIKPVSKGRITSLYGKRNAPTVGASTYHKGIDIGVQEGTPVYPTANGIVGAIVEKSTCGGNMLYIWVTVKGKQYTTVFMHLKSFAPGIKVGDKVNVNQIVAYSGGGKSTASKYGGYDRCTTGAHLHYGLASDGWYGSGKSTPLSSFNTHTMNPPGYPGLYQWFYSRI